MNNTPEEPKRNRVWIIEDNKNYSESVSLAITQTDDFRCTKQFADWESVSGMLSETKKPDIILSDIGLPGMSGIKGAALAHERTPDIPVIMLTVHDEDDKVFNAICAGASGYLLKSATQKEIIEALHQTLEGGSPVNAQIARKVLGMFSEMHGTSKKYDLTERETEVLRLIIDGQTKKAISLELDISFHTVDSHIRHIYDKLHVHCRSDAVAKAIREKLV